MRNLRKAAEGRVQLVERLVKVECYAGYKGEERPVRVLFGERAEEVKIVEDRWYSPGATYFRVVVESGDRYILRHDDAQDVWTIEGFRGVTGSTGAVRLIH
jgi:hypothetical protein